MYQYVLKKDEFRNVSICSKQVFWVWIINALIHSSLLYWLPLMALKQDVAWANGRDGGYLLLGNFVYTVNFIYSLNCDFFILRKRLCIVWFLSML